MDSLQQASSAPLGELREADEALIQAARSPSSGLHPAAARSPAQASTGSIYCPCSRSPLLGPPGSRQLESCRYSTQLGRVLIRLRLAISVAIGWCERYTACCLSYPLGFAAGLGQLWSRGDGRGSGGCQAGQVHLSQLHVQWQHTHQPSTANA